MNDILVLQLPARPDAPCWWQVFDRAGNGIGLPRQGPLAEPAAHAATRRVIALVPGEQVACHSTPLPTRNRERLAQAAAGALEDRLATDIELLHFAPAAAPADGVHTVGVVARADLDAWLGRLREAGLEPDSLMPDYLGLPDAADRWHVACSDGRVLVRNGARSGCSGSADLVLAVLARWLEQPPAQLSLYADAADATAEAVARMAEERGVAVERVSVSSLERAAMCVRGALRPALDLRTGAYRMTRPGFQDLGRWRLAGLLGLAWLLVLALHTGVDLWRLQHAADELATAIRTTYQPLLPGIDNIDIARLELENRVAASAGGGATTRLIGELATLGDALQGPGVTLRGLDYQAGRWQLSVAASDVATLESLRDRLGAELGRPVTLAEAASDGGRVAGRLLVEPAP